MEEKKSFKKNFIWNILGTGFNSFNSLFFLIIATRINGVDNAGIFTIAFSTACILFVIGQYSGRVFQVTEVDKKISDKDFIVNRILTCILMMISVLFFVLVKGYNSYKASLFIILAFYKMLEAFSDVLYGIMQKEGDLYKVGQSYFIKSLAGLIIFIIVDIITKNLIISSICMNLVWILVIVLFDIVFLKGKVNYTIKTNWNNVWLLFKKGFFIFGITFLGIYILNASKYSIDNYLENSYQTIFGIIVMPATAISLFGQFLIHPYLNKFTKLNEEKNYKDLTKLKNKIVIYVLGFGLFASIMAYAIGIPVLNLIYGVELSSYRVMLTIIVVAATLYNVGIILSNILTTMRFTFVQFVIYVVVSLIAFVVSNILTKKYGIQGAVFAYLATMGAQFISYCVTQKIIFTKLKKC